MKTLLFSGGIDSTYLMENNEYDQLIFVNYGQTNLQNEYLLALKAGAKVVSCPPIKPIGFSHVYPSRNLILATIAWINGATEIHIGCNKDDREEYEDCRPEYWDMVGLPVVLPLADIPKSEIKANSKTWSCYHEGFIPCGLCASCRRLGL